MSAIYDSVEAVIISSSTAVLFIKLSQVSSQSKLSIPPVKKVQAMFACDDAMHNLVTQGNFMWYSFGEGPSSSDCLWNIVYIEDITRRRKDMDFIFEW